MKKWMLSACCGIGLLIGLTGCSDSRVIYDARSGNEDHGNYIGIGGEGSSTRVYGSYGTSIGYSSGSGRVNLSN